MPAIAVQGLTKRYGATTAVDDLSFEVEPGRICGFLGPNGAGKTTTLRMLLGLVHPTSGNTAIGGRPFGELERPAREIGAVLEHSGFHPQRSARDQLRVQAALIGDGAERVDALLERVGLTEAAARKVGKFSLGMKQRLGIATALLGEPRVLVLDEPANGLDPQGVRWLRDAMRAFADEGGTVLVSSHLLNEVAQSVDEVVVIDRGRRVAQLDIAELSGAAIRLRSPEAERLVERLPVHGLRVRRESGDVVVAEGTTADAVGRAVAAEGIVLHEMTAHASLEETFLALTGERGEGAAVAAADGAGVSGEGERALDGSGAA